MRYKLLKLVFEGKICGNRSTGRRQLSGPMRLNPSVDRESSIGRRHKKKMTDEKQPVVSNNV